MNENKVKLSSLIRKGAEMLDNRQYRGDYKHISKGVVSCCALGAAYYALTGKLPQYSNVEARYKKPTVTSALIDATQIGTMRLYQVIDDNDEKGLSFEQIAEKLEKDGY